MNSSKCMYISLLRCALKGETPQVIPGANWQRIYDMAKASNMLYAVNSAIGRLAPGEGPDEALATRFAEGANFDLYTQILQDYEFAGALEALKRAGVRHCPVKGMALRPLYPGAAMRTMSDADVFIHPQDAEAAKEAMAGIGFAFVKDNHTHMIFEKPPEIVMELHERPLSEYSAHRDALGDLWAQMIPAGGGLYQMPEELFYIYLLLHLDKHMTESGFGVRPLMDFWELRRVSGDLLLNKSVCERLKSIGLYGLARSIRQMEGAWFDSDALPDALFNAQEWILDGGIYGSEEQNVIRFLEAEEKTGEKPTRETILPRYILGRIFLPLSRLRMAYPELEKQPARYPICLMKRWLALMKKAKLIRKRVSVLEQVTPDKVDRQREVIRTLYEGKE